MRNSESVEKLNIPWGPINIEIPFCFTEKLDIHHEETIKILRMGIANLMEKSLARIQENKWKSGKKKVAERAKRLHERIGKLLFSGKKKKSVHLVDSIQQQIKLALEKELTHQRIEPVSIQSPWVGNIFIKTQSNPQWIRLLTITTNDLLDDQFDTEKYLNTAIKIFNKKYFQEVVNI